LSLRKGIRTQTIIELQILTSDHRFSLFKTNKLLRLGNKLVGKVGSELLE